MGKITGFLEYNRKTAEELPCEERVQNWDVLDIDPNELSESDLVLDWRADDQCVTQNLRYVHQFTPEKLKSLGETAGLILKETFYSDGKEGNLGLYQIWQKP